MLKKMTKEKGITIIGLVVTIIVMIILAGVTISVMKGDSGIISKADESKNSSKRSELIERAKIKVSDKVVNKGGTLLTKDELREILENYFINVPEDYTLETILKTKEENGKYEIKVSEIYDREFWGDDEETPDNPVTPPEPTPTNPTTQPTTSDTGGEDTSGSTEIDVRGIEIDKKSVILDISEENTVQLNAKVKPANANKNTKVIWESEDNNIASVNENGLVTGKEVGITNIIATTENGVHDAKCFVKCQAKITGITVSPTTANIQVGQKIQLTAVTTPEIVTEKITWKSRNEEVATVDENGNVTGIRNGTVEIIAQNPSATIKAVCLINVQTEPVEVRLNYSVLVIDINSTDIPKLEAMVIPNTANVNANITWKSSDPSIVEVDGGNIIPIKNGNAVITARTDNGIEATCDIIVQTSPLGVTLNKNKITLDMSGTKTAKLIATINPYTANVNKDITWTSSNTDIAEVEDGLVTGISNGTVVITAMTANGKYAECIVEVQTSPTEVKLNYSSLILEKSALASPTLSATILPESANVNTNITWSSSNTSVVAVDNGKLAVKGNGSTTITVKTDNGCRSQCTIVIRTSITSIEVSPTSKKMEVNQTAQLTATVNPADTTEKVQWTSSNTDVATVNDTGLVTAKASGTATITVKNSDGKKSATCEINVIDGYLLGRENAYITKIDSEYKKEWSAYINDGTLSYGEINAIVQTSDGGYLLGRENAYITKLNSEYKKEWSAYINDGTLSYGAINAIVQTSDGGYLLGREGAYITKIDSEYKKEWSAYINDGTLSYGAINAIVQTSDGGYLLGREGAYITKIDSEYKKEWSAYINDGTLSYGEINAIVQTSDGGYLLGRENAYITKIDSEYKKEWSAYINDGTLSYGAINAIVQTSDGGYLLGRENAYITKLNSEYKKEWSAYINDGTLSYGSINAIVW